MPSDQETFITVVSGLPRSGTSLLMRMLEAGGLPVLTDGVRQPDEDNPRGYYEFEPAKHTSQDDSWLETAAGKGVKMVYRLLYDLPPRYSYRVLFTERPLEEVLQSQRKMLQRQGRPADTIDEGQLANLFRRELDQVRSWLAQQPNFALLEVGYHALLEQPLLSAEKISRFLGGGLDSQAMCRMIEPALYRNRARE